MSSFKRKGSVKSAQSPLYRGTRASPASPISTITSTGIPSLDDILGGGLPLSCNMLIIAPDLHSSYGSLVQKYFVAEGLASGHCTVVVDSHPEEFVKDLMWFPKTALLAVPKNTGENVENGESDDEGTKVQDQKIKIAWRYEQMKQFQTSVQNSSLSSDDYCHTFDLSVRVSETIVQEALQSRNLIYVDVARLGRTGESSMVEALSELAKFLTAIPSSKQIPIRICIPLLGSPSWGSTMPQDLSCFLYSLRLLLRKHPISCASIGLPAYIANQSWGGTGWHQRLGWLTDATIALNAFSADPSLSSAFPSHHGLVHIWKLPSPHMLVPPSDRFSMLRGLSGSSSGSGGGGENNLAFKCTRKRLIFETLHLDVEGGVSERRTTPSVTSDAMRSVTGIVAGDSENEGKLGDARKPSFAKVDVCLEQDVAPPPRTAVSPTSEAITDGKPKKKKKSVAFQSDRPDLYDF